MRVAVQPSSTGGAALQPRVVISANSSWNIINFRSELIRGLKRARFDPIIVSPDDGGARKKLQALDVELIEVAIDRSGMTMLHDVRLLSSYFSILKRLAPAAYLGFTIKPNIYGCIAARVLQIPSIANISGLGTVFVKQSMLTVLVVALYKFALRRTNVIFFQNSDDRALFIDRGIIRAEQARLLPGSGIDLDRFVPAPVPQGPFKFLLVARLLGDKGVREYVDAARALKRELPEVTFQLLGGLDEGNRTAIAKDELDRWVAEGIIEHLGQADDVRPFIRAASALVLPSYREGLPRTLLEGAAMARPLIATDVPGCRDIVSDGVNGFLCRSHDWRSLAGAMRKLLALPAAERRQMGAAGRKLAEDRFSVQRVVDAYVDALAEITAPG